VERRGDDGRGRALLRGVRSERDHAHLEALIGAGAQALGAFVEAGGALVVGVEVQHRAEPAGDGAAVRQAQRLSHGPVEAEAQQQVAAVASGVELGDARSLAARLGKLHRDDRGPGSPVEQRPAAARQQRQRQGGHCERG
jgi:hypothetical protein